MTDDDRQPLSEEAALQQLEELHREIERTRLRRKDANEAFDRFLRSFDRTAPPPAPPRRPPAPPPSPPLPPPPPPLPPPVPEAVVAPPSVPPPQPEPAEERYAPLNQPPDVVDRLPEFVSEEAVPSLDKWEAQAEPTVSTFVYPTESEVAARAATFAAPPAEVRPVPAALSGAVGARGGRRLPPAIGLLGIVAAGAIAFFLWRGIGGEPEPADSTATATPAAQSPPASAPALPAPAPAVPQAPPAAEVSTIRRAWVRVVVDGRKVIERELPADSHVPLEAGSEYVVRAGDAGAVRLAIRGKDQGVVGADGQVATKTYTAAAKTGR